MAELLIPSVRRGFSSIGGEIHEVCVKVVNVRFDEGKKPSDLLVRYSDGECVIEKSNFFENMTELKKASPVSWSHSEWTNRFFGSKLKDDNYDYWMMENGMAVHKKGTANEILIHLDENGIVTNMESPDIPVDSYESADECYSFNDITIINADGTRTVEHGIATLCMLTPYQQELMKQFEELNKKADECGLVLVHDWNGMYAFNSSNVKDIEFNYENPDDEHEMIDLTNKAFKCTFNLVVQTSDDDALYVIRKND